MNPEIVQDNITEEFLWQRFAQDCPNWAIAVPVLFAFFVVALVVFFRQERKMMSAIIGVSIVGAISLVYLPMALILKPVFTWMVILVPIMTVALFYVVLMYIRDARSVHPIVAIFLGLLRTTVYLVLAVVFMLPGCQRSERQEYESKVLILLDVSGSISVIDDLPEEGQKPETLLSRQDKVLKFLLTKKKDAAGGEASFVEDLATRTPLTLYRFGGILDETEILEVHQKKNKILTDEQLTLWAKPNRKAVEPPNLDNAKDEEQRKEWQTAHSRKLEQIDTLRGGTNIGGAALQAHKIENNHYIQAIIIISDGQSNVGSDDAKTEFLARAANPRKPIPVITVGVGEFRLPSAVRIDELQAPEETRPDDKFPVRVPVVGTNLHGEGFKVILEARRFKDLNGRVVDEKPFELPIKEGKFKGAGDHPLDLVEFEIDVQALKNIKVKDDKGGELEGEWQFRARVPRNAKEAFPDPEHVTEWTKVQVQKRALRILMFAGGSTREYQFLRSVLYREMIEKRMEFCICNQQSFKDDHVDQDVPPERMLSDFPSKIGPNDPGQQFMSLSDYDVVVAFDPDWAKLTGKQLSNLKEWVGEHGGGVIFIAGPVHSYLIARPGGRDLTALQSIYPVVPQDNRLHNVNIGKLGHDSTRPYALSFTPAAKLYEFLKLEEGDENPTAGWNGFFYNNDKLKVDPAKAPPVKRGFFSYYPIERLKPNAIAVAEFLGPKEAKINGGKDNPPFMVLMPYGNGKTMFIGSGEMWRLRAFKDGYFERLWFKMARNVSAGATQQKKYGTILMSRNLPVGVVNFEAQLKGKDLLPLDKGIIPTVRVRRIDKDKDDKADPLRFDLQPKPFDEAWKGYFQGTIHIKEPGEYEFQLPIPGMENESLKQNLIVRKPNPELDNVRTNYGYLYQLASDAGPLLKTLPADTRKEVEASLQIPAEVQGEDRGSRRLFFPLGSADTIAKCIVPIPPRTENAIKGPPEQLWAMGAATDLVRLIAALACVALGIFGAIVFAILRQYIFAVFLLLIGVMIPVLVALAGYFLNLEVNFAYVLTIVVVLLGVEWLTRKLLRLA